MKFLHSNNQKNGFTLVEIMVSVAIFTIIITIGMGALVSLIDSYQISRQEKNVHDNLNYALEAMIREIRLGQNYYADASPSGVDTGAVGGDGIGDSLGFDAADNRGYVVYYVENGALMVYRNGGVNDGVHALTDSSQITIDSIRFTVTGTDPLNLGDHNQPLVWIQVQATYPGETRETTVQTLVSQRTLDV
ncbi:type II secretion system protein [Patescibacteria group bacterium]|nr:type II secretion system protein [Patescibacteria group bacterium]